MNSSEVTILTIYESQFRQMEDDFSKLLVKDKAIISIVNRRRLYIRCIANDLARLCLEAACHKVLDNTMPASLHNYLEDIFDDHLVDWSSIFRCCMELILNLENTIAKTLEVQLKELYEYSEAMDYAFTAEMEDLGVVNEIDKVHIVCKIVQIITPRSINPNILSIYSKH